jgi:hypothetical protein
LLYVTVIVILFTQQKIELYPLTIIAAYLFTLGLPAIAFALVATSIVKRYRRRPI